jgi:hypothetical protein
MYELDNILDDFGIDTNELKLKEWFKWEVMSTWV